MLEGQALLHEPVPIFLTIMAVLLIAPLLTESVRLPGLIGIILAGMLIGPHGTRLLDDKGAIELFATVGLLYLMFGAGLEVDLNQFNRVRGKALIFGALTYLIPQAAGLAFGRWLGLSWPGAILLGSAFSSHTLIALPILSRMGLVSNEAVSVTVGATVMTDITAFLVLAGVVGANKGDVSPLYYVQLSALTLGYAALVLIVFPRLGKLFFKRFSGVAIEFQFVLVALFVAAALAELVGVHAVVGAFLAGLALNATLPHHSPALTRVLFIGEAFFIPVFLMYSGMITDPLAFVRGTEVLLIGLGMTIIAYVTKLLAAWIVGRVFKYSTAEMWVAFGLSQAQAAVTIPTLIIGVNLGLFQPEIFNAGMMMILFTSITSPLFVQRFARQLHPAAVEKGESQPFERVLLAVDDPEQQEHLITLASILARSDRGVLLPLFVAREANGKIIGLEREKEVLETRHFRDPDTSIQLLTRVDSSVARGILRAAVETHASLIVLGWDGEPSRSFNLLGTVHDRVALEADVPVMIARVTSPINAIDRVTIVVPPDAFSMAAARQALRMALTIAEEINVPFTMLASPGHIKLLRRELEEIKPDHPLEFVEVTGDIVKAAQEFPDNADDLIVIATAGSERRFRSSMGRVPERIAASCAASVVVIRQA